jgi:hypothetical protein
MKLDEFLPNFDFHEVHSVTINASPDKTYAATKGLLSSELSPLVHLFLSIRMLPARFMGKSSPVRKVAKPFLTQMTEGGFAMLADSNHEIVIGAIGQFWKPAAVKTFINVTGPQAFLDFNHNGFAKVAMNLAVQPDGNKTMLSTETRIWVPDEKTRKKFAFYWRFIAWGSGWIRTMWLNAIKRRAESA